ncbi:protein CutA homolog [Cylas formicarius]|uniref:protein CutA homolog n=1 Tax=Cylas formicarius TaxID=197179 RepID=UPI002958CE13|nr:protein CutA homolog [Cylas formicarius]
MSLFSYVLITTILSSVSRRLATATMSADVCQKNQTSQTITQFSAVYVTTPNEDVAKKLAHGLVKEQLAACVNIIPQVTSVYQWENKIHEDSELLLMIKTRTSKVDSLTAFVKANHPYKVCEVVSVPITNGNEAYFNWIREVVPEK